MKTYNDSNEVIFVCSCHTFTWQTYADYEKHAREFIARIERELVVDKNIVLKPREKQQ